MNIWTEKSIELANQRDYLDQLYRVYPMANNLKREINEETFIKLEEKFNSKNKIELIKLLLEQELFPIKDSYVSYLRRDKSSIRRNPETINRLSGIIYELGFNKIIDLMSQPKETNRQIGPLFRNWIRRNSLGAELTTDTSLFLSSEKSIILDLSDDGLMNFAKLNLGYKRNKGLDFIAKFNNKFVVGESKFLTDFGGHQNAQFEDAIQTIKSNFKNNREIIPIAILDGVLYIKGNNKLYKTLENLNEKEIVISSLLLRNFLYSL